MPRLADRLLNIRVNDAVQQALDEFDRAEGWTAEKKKAFTNLSHVLREDGYIEINSDCRTYGLQTKG